MSYSLNIISLIKNTPSAELFDAINNMMSMAYTPQTREIFGEGSFGIVYRSTISPMFDVVVKNDTIRINTVVKKMKDFGGGFFMTSIDQKSFDDSISKYFDATLKVPKINIADNTTILFSYDDITGEMIILMYLSKLWYDSITPHVPYLVMPIVDNSVNKIDSLMLEMNGLPKPYTYKLRKSIPSILGKFMSMTHLETMFELLQFITNHYEYDEKNDKYMIPRLVFHDSDDGIKLQKINAVDVVELIDSLMLSYLITIHQLKKLYKFSLSDQRLANIFLCYPQFGSFVGVKNISKLKAIRYDIGDESYKVRVHDVIIKIGDVGVAIVQPKDDLYITSYCNNTEYNHNKIPLISYLPTYIEFLKEIDGILPSIISSRLISNRIMNSGKIKEFTIVEGADFEYPTEIELIREYYGHYKIGNNAPAEKNTPELFVVTV